MNETVDTMGRLGAGAGLLFWVGIRCACVLAEIAFVYLGALAVISFKVRGLEEFKEHIGSFARNLRGIVTEAIAEYLLGNTARGLRHYVHYKYVSRKSAYGVSFFSERQRRYVMAKIASGEIRPGRPNRTNTLRNSWNLMGKGVNTRIVNTAPYAKYVMGTGTQARQPAKVGWRQVADVIATNVKGAIRHAEAKIREWYSHGRH